MMTDTPWIPIALGEYGVTEVPGSASNRRIRDYLRIVGLQTGDDCPWCSAFVSWCLKQAGYPVAKAAARSYMQYGVSIPEPTFGSLAVLWRGEPTGWQGHVGFVIKTDAANVWLLGGNQGDRVCIQPYPLTRLLGYRWPVR